MKTLKEIAEEMGVSVATVSYVYNNKWKQHGITQKLAEKIQRKLKEENYRPNCLGLQLKTKRTQTIGIVLGDMTRRFNLDILAGIEKVLSTKGYFTLVCSSNLGKREAEQLEILSERNVDGIIFSPESKKKSSAGIIKKLTEDKMPLVFVDNYIPELETDFVVSDNYSGAYEAVKYLIKRGRKKIAYIGVNKDLTALKDRFTGYMDALKVSDIDIDTSLIYKNPADILYPGALSEIFSKAKPDAIFVESLLYFKEGFKFFYEKGIKIPDDVLLTGFDPVDLSLSEITDVGFHSVVKGTIPFIEQKGEEMGIKTAKILLEAINGKTEPQQIFIKPELKNFE